MNHAIKNKMKMKLHKIFHKNIQNNLKVLHLIKNKIQMI